MLYTDFTIRARDYADGHFKVEVTASPVDRTREAEAVYYDAEALRRPLHNLERKRLPLGDLIALGERLADLLLPPTVRQMLLRSLDSIGADGGLRLRLVLDAPEVANLPWEYLYLQRVPGEKGRDGFLALDPRISIVRHEAMPTAPGSVTAVRPLKVVVGLAAPQDSVPLDLEAERGFIEAALDGEVGIELDVIEHLTVEKLEAAIQGAHLFHFAGHGGFPAGRRIDPTRDLSPERWDAEEDQGALALEDAQGRQRLYAAEKLSLTLRSSGVRVVVMGACETGRRDRISVWNGVATALVRAGIPGAVAMQFEVYDESAVAFARRFYASLAVGMTLDEAVVQGRIAMLNAGGANDAEWGVPVLYMRTEGGVVFPQLTDNPDLETTREALRVDVQQRIRVLEGKAIGADIGTMTAGHVKVGQRIEDVQDGGEVIGVRIENLGGHRK